MGVAHSANSSSVFCDTHSGGGAVDAIAPLVDAILYAKSKGKAVVAHCDLCASAAYYAASYCDEIIASNTISAEFGSIGVMMSFPDYAKYYENAGVKVPIFPITRMLRLKRPRKVITLPSVTKNWTRWQGIFRQMSGRTGVNV